MSDTYYWIGGTNDVGAAGSWETYDAENGLQVATIPPNATSDEEVDTGGELVGSGEAQQLNIDASVSIDGTTDVGSGTIIGGGQTAGTVTVDGGEWTDTAYLTVGLTLAVGNTVDGALVIENGGVVADASAIVVGQFAGGVGILDILNASTLTTTGFSSIGGSAGGIGIATIDGVGSTWQSSGAIDVGNSGTGDLTISDDAIVYAANGIVLGANVGGLGIVTLSTGGTLEAGTGDLNVGGNGGGTLIVNGSGSVESFGSSDAVGGGSEGSVVLDGAGASWTSQGYLTIGGTGSGTVTVDGGNLTSHDGIALGENVGGSGTVTLSNGGTFDAGTGGLNVGGGGGSGTLIVNGSGSVESFGTYDAVGNGTGSQGSVVLDGAGASWTSQGKLTIGNSGTGDLSVSGLASVYAAGGLGVGTGPGSVGDVTIASGGIVDAINSITLGGTSASGAVTIAAGSTLELTGTLNPNAILLQIGAGGSGTLAVSGAGALLTTDGNPASVGQNGNGTLLISNGATASFGVSVDNANSALLIGYAGNGSVIVSGPGSTLTAVGAVSLAHSGTGSLTVSNYGSFFGGDSASDIVIGNGNTNGTGGVGIVVINSDGYLHSVHNIGVGNGGDSGTLDISGGAKAEAANGIYIGNTNSQNGTLVGGNGFVMVGAGSTLQADGTDITSTGTNAINIGDGPGTTGTLDVTGAGALVTTSGNRLAIGTYGRGYVTISDAGTIDSGNQFPTSDAALIIGLHGGAGYLTVTDSGSSYDAAGQVYVGDGGSGTLTVENGGIFTSGTIIVGVTTSSAGFVDVTGTNSQIDVSGLVAIGDAGIASLSIGNNATLAAGTLTLSAPDELSLLGGLLDVASSITNFGTISATDGFGEIAGMIGGAGSLVIGADADLQIDGAVGNLQSVSFSSPDSTLILGDGADFAGTITGSAAGDTIEVIDATSGTFLGDILQLYAGGGEIGTLAFSSLPSGIGLEFGFSQPPCYCRGTLIETDHGEVAVEDLRIGDCLITNSGVARPIVWIGRRHYAGRFAAGNRDVLPIVIRAGALADNTPRRDLLVSPLHAMYIDECLIPAAALVNGTSIVQVETVDSVDYFHVELETHDVILAEGAPSESFVDDDSRGMFHNAAEYRLLYPEAPEAPALYCAPRVEDGEMLEAVRRRLEARSKPPRVPASIPGTLLGRLDEVGRGRISGWAQNAGAPDRPALLRILDRGATIGVVAAGRFRPDLAEAGIGSGFHGFVFDIPGGLCPDGGHTIQVVRAEDGCELANSPWVLPVRRACRVGGQQMGEDRAGDGRIDVVTREQISGWARDESAPDTALALQIIDNGRVIARVLANHYRPDLAAAGIGRGWHGFDLRIQGGLSPLSRHVIEVRREDNGASIAAPSVIEPASSFDDSLEQTVARAVAALDGTGEQERVLSFILAQADRLRQQEADSQAQRTAREDARRRRRGGPAASASQPPRRALVIDEKLPGSGLDGGAVAILSHVRALQRLGYAVSFVAADDMAHGDAGLTAAGVTVCAAPFYASVEDVLRRQAGCFDVVYLHRVGIAARYLALVRTFAPRARVIYSVADLHHLRLARQAAVEGWGERMAESHRLRVAECNAAWSADAVITHSPHEAAVLRQVVPGAKIHIVPWAVTARPVDVSFAKRHGVAFLGSFAHAPNVDAARFLAEDVMPLVWQLDPSIDCLLAGSSMPDAIKRLARPGVIPIGQVADLADVFDRVRLTAAPLRYGAGLKAKILASFAAGVPCVMSPIAAEGIVLPAPLDKAVSASPAEIAARIVHYHSAGADNRRAAQAGLALIEEGFGEEGVAAALLAAIRGQREQVRRHAGDTVAAAAAT